MEQQQDPVIVRHRELERIANMALRAGRIMMECGASVSVVHGGVGMIARGFGVEDVGMRSGYASLEITVHAGGNTITRMMQVGRLGVNHRLDQAVRKLAVRVCRRAAMSVDEVGSRDRPAGPGDPPPSGLGGGGGRRYRLCLLRPAARRRLAGIRCRSGGGAR